MTYANKYGGWAGNPKGFKPDFTRCCEKVYSNGSWGSTQCSRKRGYGPERAYCKQHDPVAVQRRRQKSDYEYNLASYKRRVQSFGVPLRIIQQIADGHNDPRYLCQKWLEENTDRLTPPKKPEWMK